MSLVNRIITNLTGSDSPSPRKAEMVLEASTGEEQGSPQSKKDESGVPRVEKSELEATYISDGVVFNSLNKHVALLMGAKTHTSKPYFFEGRRRDVRFFEEFYDQIGVRGSQLDDLDFFERVFMDEFVYGENYNENIMNRSGSRIVDLDVLDPKKMSPATDSSGKVLVDKYNNYLGFVQTHDPSKNFVGSRKYEPPENRDVDFSSHQIWFPPENINFNKYVSIGDGLRGIGVVEPVYNMIKYKMNIEDAFAQSWLRVGQPIPVGYVGDETNLPNEDQLKNMLEELQQMDNRGAISVPYHNRVELLEPRRRFSLRDDLNHFVDGVTTGLGIPSPFALGKGDTNRAIIGIMKHFMELTLVHSVRKTLRNIERQQINRIVRLHNLSAGSARQRLEPVKLKWGEFSLQELDSQSARLASYLGAGLLTADEELEDHIRRIEGLPAKKREE